MSAFNNYLLKLIDNLQEDNEVLRKHLKERNLKNISLRQELEQSQKITNHLKNEIDDIKECQICNERFDHENHKPAKANCGHILYCKLCLIKIGNTTHKCPACRKQFESKHVTPVNLSFV